MKLIDADAALEALIEKGQTSRRYRLGEIWELNGQEIREVLNALPSAQPEAHEGHWIPNEGYWIKYDKRFPWRHLYKCSNCGNYLDFSGVNSGRGEANYCPNCGADMRGEKND